MTNTIYNAIGLMSGTSLDGVFDVALIRTDGRDYVEPVAFHAEPYDLSLRGRVRALFGLREDTDGRVAEVAEEVTRIQAQGVLNLLKRGHSADIIGFHGQTISHDPASKFTWQIGDGALMAALTGIDTVCDFRKNDVQAGGQGAPLIPLYHRARAMSAGLALPVAILNIGGVSNVTWIGAAPEDILAFDTGPGNAMMDDAVGRYFNLSHDEDGKIAASGKVDEKMLAEWMAHDYFSAKPPKSLDRNDFEKLVTAHAPLTPGAKPDYIATLAAFTIESISRATEWFPAPAKAWYITGGGRKNAYLMEGLRKRLGVKVESVDTLGWDGDAMEAEGFGYLAVRSLKGLPLSLPTTTGVPKPMLGGQYFKAEAR